MIDAQYQVFISYSHDADQQLAAALQSSLSRFAKPWYRLRSMRVFRDKTGLAANPALWHSIEQALGESKYLLLLACPASARSPWVEKEVQWWLQNRSLENLVIGLTDGMILWGGQARDFDWEHTTAIPTYLKHAFAAEPLYADFRAAKASGKFLDSDTNYRSALLDVAAPLLGRAKDDLDGEDIRLHRKAKRIASTATALIVLLGIVAAVGIIVAGQRQKVAASRTLASEAASPLADRSLALLLSMESRRIADTVESRRSLLAAIQILPHAEAFLWGHTNAVTKAVFSPDGQTVLSAGWDDRIILWSVAIRQRIGQPIASAKGLVDVAFNSDGSRFASSASDSIVIWDTQSRQPLETFTIAKEDFVRVAFSPDGKLIVASTEPYGGHPSRVFVWDVASHQLIGEPAEGSNFAFAPDSSRLAVAQYHDLIIYDVKSHRPIRRPLTGHSKNISAVAFSPDGLLVAAGSEDKTIILWDLQSQQRLGTLEGHTETVTSLLFHPGGRVLLSGSRDGTIIRWNLEDVTPIDVPIKSFGASISSIFSGDHGHVRALALENERVIMLNANEDPPLGRRIRAPGAGSSNAPFSPDGRFLASAGEFGDIQVRDAASGEPHGPPLSGHERRVSSLAYAPDGKVLVSGSEDGTVMFWDMATHTPLGPPTKSHRSPIWSLAYNPDGKTAVSGGDAEMVFWDVATRTEIGQQATSQKDRIWTLAFSPNGEFLASAGNELVVDIWKTGNESQPMKTFGSPRTKDQWELVPVAVAFNPDGMLLATSTRQDSVSIWNFKTGRLIQPVLYGHTQSVSSVAFRHDGKVLASGAEDGDIRLWDVDTHELIGTLSAQQRAVHSVAFSPRQGTLVSVGEDDSLVFWDIDFEGWSKAACRIANRNLTPTEWDTYNGNRPYRKTCPGL